MSTFASLFAGIEGFGSGLESAGMRCEFQVELDEQCRSVLARHWPNVPRWNDVREFNGTTTAIRPDWLTGGFPCQDLSVAGRRAGLAGERSGLWHEFHRIIGEFRPRGVLIENVPGLLSSNGGRDMGIVLGGLGQLGYGWAFRVLDAQWFGVAQRRRRVFIVGHLGGVRRAAEILFERNCLPWDSPPSRAARARVAASLTAGVASGSGVNRPGRRREDDVNLVNCLDRHMGAGGPDDNAAQANHLITHTLRAEGFDASEDGTGRGTPLVPVAIAFDWMAGESGNDDSFRGKSRKWITRAGEYTGALGASKRDGVCQRSAVRRLTPRECERLQGFPDDWTRYGHDGKEISDSARYRMLGNAVNRKVAEWLGERITEGGSP